MRFPAWVITCACFFVLNACGPSTTQEQQAFLGELANRPMTCTRGEDCEAKWNRAIEWVDEHASYKIRRVSENLIQTNAMIGSDGRTHGPEYTITKYARTKDLSVIKFASACDQQVDCNPSGLKLRASFASFVMGLPPGVTEIQPGVFQKKVYR